MIEAITKCLPPGTSTTASFVSYHLDFTLHSTSESAGEASITPASTFSITPAFSAPLTEWLFLTLKDGKTKDDIIPLLNEIRDKLAEDAKTISGLYVPMLWAQTVEDPRVFAALLGWDSVEVHRQVGAQEKYGEVMKTLLNTADFKVTHTPFEKNI
ncbi:hypothetical protein CVT24_010155 [Panaeolus cyanescens]|uniref:ABM domain-containing protein n=1 Tax=Panaeolus cyanescens TaxID=181874 RepID=A0A409W9C2_9AGAR|nr:hypothetical protein CVT24_010155 [Panaeolus cyanescens]